MLREPLSVRFANTRTSLERDQLKSRAQWQAWVRAAPGLKPLGLRVDSEGLSNVRELRDDVQNLLRAAATKTRADDQALARTARLARRRVSYELSWTLGGLVLVAGADDATTVISHHLARTALDWLLTVDADALRTCEGHLCLKVFVTSRRDKRWCDSTVCGNRARVSLHAARTANSASGADDAG